MSKKVMCLVVCGDDTLLHAKNAEDIDEVICKLTKECDMALEVEDDAAGFLGVEIKKTQATGCVTLKQDGLKKKIIKALKIDNLPAVHTPADRTLGKDEDGEEPHCDFGCSRVVGMTFCQCSQLMPEIGFAISQLAQFTFSPINAVMSWL